MFEYHSMKRNLNFNLIVFNIKIDEKLSTSHKIFLLLSHLAMYFGSEPQKQTIKV
jgi:hypothetical protein